MAKGKEFRVPVTVGVDSGRGFTIGEIMELLAPACERDDDEAITRILDESFIFGAWGHKLSAAEGSIEDGELRRLRANIRGLIIGAYRWQRPLRAVAPASREAYAWRHFVIEHDNRHGPFVACGRTDGCDKLNFQEAFASLKGTDCVEQVNCPECLRWLIDYLVSQLAAVQG